MNEPILPAAVGAAGETVPLSGVATIDDTALTADNDMEKVIQKIDQERS